MIWTTNLISWFNPEPLENSLHLSLYWSVSTSADKCWSKLLYSPGVCAVATSCGVIVTEICEEVRGSILDHYFQSFDGNISSQTWIKSSDAFSTKTDPIIYYPFYFQSGRSQINLKHAVSRQIENELLGFGSVPNQIDRTSTTDFSTRSVQVLSSVLHNSHFGRKSCTRVGTDTKYIKEEDKFSSTNLITQVCFLSTVYKWNVTYTNKIKFLKYWNKSYIYRIEYKYKYYLNKLTLTCIQKSGKSIWLHILQFKKAKAKINESMHYYPLQNNNLRSFKHKKTF